MAAADFRVGHFELPLTINEGSIVQITADHKEENHKRFLGLKSHRPERHAIRNLLGVLAFRRQRVQEAKDYFNKILEPGEDPDNLNARANLNYVERQTLSDEEYVTSGVGIAASNLGPHVSPKTEKKRQGRRYAEQAFAFMYENYHETLTYERYSKAMELYNTAMNLAGDLVDHEEKDDWHLGIGLASMKIFKAWTAKFTREEALRHFQTIITNNSAVINSETADRDMISDAFLRVGLSLGEALRRTISVNEVKIPLNLVKIFTDEEMCLKKALAVAESDSSKASICTRLAVIRNRARDFDGALGLLNESIRLDGSRHNFHAFSTRASMYLKQFKFIQKENARRRQKPPVDIRHLTKAKADLELILQEHVSPWDFRILGDVCYHLAKNSTGPQSKEYIEEALDACEKSGACQDGADSPEHYKIKGQCLCFIGEHQQALESFKRGLECEKKTGKVFGNDKLLDEEKTHLR